MKLRVNDMRKRCYKVTERILIISINYANHIIFFHKTAELFQPRAASWNQP